MKMKILDRKVSEEKFLKNLINIKDKKFNYDISNKNLIKPEWEKNRLSLRNKLDNIDINFLTKSGIGGLMFQSDLKTSEMELQELPKEYYKDIKEYTQSNPNLEIGVSTNTIHHLYHLYKYLNSKNLEISDFKSNRIIEWGGGYGNMCKLLIELNITNNYLIVDIPEFIKIQYIYLSSYFGNDKVHIIEDIKDIKDGINLISVDNLIEFPEYDTFISNWALSESSIDCQKICINNGIFNKNMLLSYHQCGDHIPFMDESRKLHNIISNNGIYTEEIYFGGGKNYYAFR